MREESRTSSVRIQPLPREEWSEEVAKIIASVDVDGADSLNLFTTLANHPRIFRRWVPFAGALLLRSSLSPRQRELLILRTAVRINCPYERKAHTKLAADAGLCSAEVDALVENGDYSGWSRTDAALVRAADELHETGVISDLTWADLASDFDTRQLIEIPLLIGAYVMLGYFLNSAGVVADVEAVSLGYPDRGENGAPGT